jgi:HD-like signal output (HDOD) protein
MQIQSGRSDLAYLGGMLHDVGKSVALSSLSALILAGRCPRDITPATMSTVLERVHTQIGTDALRHWSMPGYLVSLCAAHHDASVSSAPDSCEIHLVRVIAGLLALRLQADVELVPPLMQSLQVLKLDPLELRALDAHVRALSQQMGQLLGLGGGTAAGSRSRSKSTA